MCSNDEVIGVCAELDIVAILQYGKEIILDWHSIQENCHRKAIFPMRVEGRGSSAEALLRGQCVHGSWKHAF